MILNNKIMETSIKQRIIDFLKYKEIGQTKFEEICGLSRGYVTKLRKSPTGDKLNKIFNAFPELDKQWLLTGAGSMLRGSGEPKATEGEDAALREEVVMLRERVRNLQKLIDEKERTIRILSRRASFDSASRLDEMA